MDWPTLPFLGLRRFEGADHLLYRGRDLDISLCQKRLSSPAVRVLVLQGMSGSGKSSFLHAGLLPRIESLLQPGQRGIVPICPIVSAGANMMRQIAEKVYNFVICGPGRSRWSAEAQTLERAFPSSEAFINDAANNVTTLISFISELSRDPRHAFLIAIDQVEDFWTNVELPNEVRENFLRLVYEFVRERLNGKLVLSIRTEQYGIFASTLPDLTNPAFEDLEGTNRLCHHYLGNPTDKELIALINHAAQQQQYGFSYQPNLVETIVQRVCAAAAASGICVLPLLQTVLLRLYLDPGARIEPESPMIATSAFMELLRRADGTGVGLLEDYTRWALGQAVDQVLEPVTGESRFRQQREMVCWRDVIRAMSQRHVSGEHNRLAKSKIEIEKLAKDAECEASTESMLDVLCRGDIGLLTRTDKPDVFVLQHDLLCYTSESSPISASLSFWRRPNLARRERIKRAGRYTVSDLFGDDAPHLEKVRIAELRFWDHRTLAYAHKLGFFERLGLSVECVTIEENISARDLMKQLACDCDAHAVFSYPRVAMTPGEKRASRDIVILNSFTGFAVICNESANLPSFRGDSGWGDFTKIVDELLALGDRGGRYFAEDPLALEFFRNLLEIEQSSSTEDGRIAAVNEVLKTTERTSLVGANFIDSLLRRTDPCVAVVTAPTWALAMSVDERILKTVIDQRTVLSLLNGGDYVTRNGSSAARRKLEVRNVMNLRSAHGRTWAKNEPMVMRLASVGLFLGDWIWADHVEACEWIRNRWNSRQPRETERWPRISLPTFVGAFRRSCGFAASHEYADRYFGASWSDDCPTSLKIHHKMLKARMKYESQVAALESELESGISEASAALIQRARRHADINNYYDANRLIRQVTRNLNPAQ